MVFDREALRKKTKRKYSEIDSKETIGEILTCVGCGTQFIPEENANYELELEGDFRATYCWKCITGEGTEPMTINV